MIPGIIPVVIPKPLPTVTFIGSSLDSIDRTTYTFNVDVGTITETTLLVMGCMGEDSIEYHDFTAASIGGTSATLAVSTGGDLLPSAVYYREVNSGGTLAFSFTVSSTSWPLRRGAVNIWKIENYQSASPYSSDSQTGTASSLTGTVDIPDGGIVISTAIANGTGTVSWTGLTEDHDNSLDSAVRVSGGSESYISGVTGQDIVLSLGSSRSARLHCVVWR